MLNVLILCFYCWPSKGGTSVLSPLSCSLFIVFLARLIVVVSIVSICFVCDSSIVATCPSIPAARFAFCLCFIRFVSVVRGCFVW